MNHSILVCPKFFTDIKHLQKKHRRQELSPTLEYNDDIEDSVKITLIPLISSITVFFSNACVDGYAQLDQWDTQPYLDKGWKIWKFRYAFAGKSKKDGLRVIMAEHKNDSYILAIYINTKNECADEAKLKKDVLARLDDFFDKSF